jgi:hypothetical protein
MLTVAVATPRAEITAAGVTTARGRLGRCSRTHLDRVQFEPVAFCASGSGEGAFECLAVGRFPVRRQHELHGPVEQRLQPGRHLLDRNAFR